MVFTPYGVKITFLVVNLTGTLNYFLVQNDLDNTIKIGRLSKSKLPDILVLCSSPAAGMNVMI
jgi:hypothetical protein